VEDGKGGMDGKTGKLGDGQEWGDGKERKWEREEMGKSGR
jgi:hypothetical protein